MKRKLMMCTIAVIALCANAQNKGYEKTIEAFGGPGLNYATNYQAGVSMINGYRVNQRLFVGVGAGFRYQEAIYLKTIEERYNNVRERESREPRYLIPLYGRLKFNLTDGTISPFVMADLGGNIDVGQVEYKTIEGLFFEPQFGVDFAINEQSSAYLSIGANIANVKYEEFNMIRISQRTKQGKANSLIFHFGVKF